MGWVLEKELRFYEIADYWSRDPGMTASKEELETLLEEAWWRGELVGAKPPFRVNVLRLIHRFCSKDVVFLLGHKAGPPKTVKLKDGGIGVDLRPRISVLSTDRDSWDDRNCEAAFEVVASYWRQRSKRLAGEIAVAMGCVKLTRDEFMRWT